VKNAIETKTLNGFGNHIKQCKMEMYGVSMPKEPKIMRMDWKSLGYEAKWVDGRIVWEPQESNGSNKQRE
jgi:hypothetical protein